MVRYLLLLLSFFEVTMLLAQRDSTLLLAPERLQERDIVTRNLDLHRTMAITATRSLEDVEQSPWSVWVITADDILRYGFVTLGDVLKAAPGLRVSSSGNALEGETFLMRGLSGNQYVKILINDVPVKPSAASGISIGAQLPIRQAQRIEVFYGPASTIYGNEACVGVINIILKESERPIFTQADISFGSDGYNSLDVMCGGKLGKDKKIFRFSAYGSSTVRERADVYYDQNLFNLNNYVPASLDAAVYHQNPNFIPDDDNNNQPKTVAAVHESRLFGINLTFRGLHFTYHRMSRADYSPLGLNPLAVSWSNSSDQLLERSETFALGFQRTRRHWIANTNISFLNYRIGNNSTTTYIFDRLSAAKFQFDQQQFPSITDSVLLQKTFAKLAQGSRHTVANGFDARLESRLNATLGSKFHLDAGLQVNFSAGVPASSYLVNPADINAFGEVKSVGEKPFNPYSDADLDATVFGQLEWRTRKWSVSAGSSTNFSTNYEQFLLATPRAAVFYKIDSVWSAFGNYATGYRRPSFYEIAQSYLLYVSNSTTAESDIKPGETPPKTAETIRSFELGVRYHKKGNRANLTFFQEQGYNLIRPGFLQKETPTGPDDRWSYGFRNTPGLALSMWGLQGLFVSENYSYQKAGRLYGYRLSGRTEVFVQYARGREWYGEQRTPTSDVFNAPRWQTQVRFVLTAHKLELMLSSNRQTSTLSKSVMYRDQVQRTTQERYPTFRTWDMRAQVYLSNHFLVYVQMQNMFNQHYAGLDATGTPDDLLYNPQPGRLVRFGLNYNMN